MNGPAIQRVLVTAGANGIGLAITESFDGAGARVHVADIDAVAAAARRGRVTGTVADISDPASVDRFFDDVRRDLGGLDVLVNNAGVAGPTQSVDEFDEAAWTTVLNVNLTGTFLVTKRAIPVLKESPAASIITMSSLAGLHGYPNRIANFTTKWGLVGFAKTLSMELGPLGITSNTVHPGAVDGPSMREVLEGRAETSGLTIDEEIETALANQSIKNFIDPADIAELIRFLAGAPRLHHVRPGLPHQGRLKAGPWPSSAASSRPSTFSTTATTPSTDGSSTGS